MKCSILPTPDPVLYVRNKYRPAGTYTKKTPHPAGTPVGAVYTLPADLKRETARAKQIRENVEEVLTIPNGPRTGQIFTGLQPMPQLNPGLFYGNIVKWANGKKIRSDASLLFSADGAHLMVQVFPSVHKRVTRTREQLAAAHLANMLQRMPPEPPQAAPTLF